MKNLKKIIEISFISILFVPSSLTYNCTNGKKMIIKNFNEIPQDYEIFFVDIWGVVHDGIKPYPGTVKKLNELIKNKKVYFISNAPRPHYVLEPKLKEFNINIEKANIISSGDVVREELKKIAAKKQKVFHIGEARNKDILQGISIDVTNKVEEAEHILLTAYLDEGEDLTQFDEIFKKAISLNKPFICANPDTIVINGNSHRYCAGYFAKRAEQLGGKVYYYGKPNTNIFQFAISKIDIKDLSYSKILMVGDTIDTDIAGASKLGIDTALVITGNAEILLKKNGITSSNHVCSYLKDYFNTKGIKPTWVIKGLF